MAESQMRPGLWEVVNARYPGSMVSRETTVPLTKPATAITESKLLFLSSSGVQPTGSLPFDVAHPVGDFTFRRVPSKSSVEDLEIHQIKYPTDGASVDLNVIFPIERLREEVTAGNIGGLTENFLTFIGYNMSPSRVEMELAECMADAVNEEGPDIVLAAPA